MERVPVLLDGQRAGELTAEAEGLYVRCRARCPVGVPRVLRLFAVGERGELRLGVPEPAAGALCLDRRLPARQLAGIGALVRGELRGGDSAPPDDGSRWQAVRDPERLFRTAYLRQQLRGRAGVLVRREPGVCRVALPFDRQRPFPLTGMFCFASVRPIAGRTYAVFAFDEAGEPLFR